jgi:hypothetical protein
VIELDFEGNILISKTKRAYSVKNFKGKVRVDIKGKTLLEGL